MQSLDTELIITVSVPQLLQVLSVVMPLGEDTLETDVRVADTFTKQVLQTS